MRQLQRKDGNRALQKLRTGNGLSKFFQAQITEFEPGGQHGKENKWPKFAEGYLEMQMKWLSAQM